MCNSCVNGCEHSIDLARTPNTSQQMSSRGLNCFHTSTKVSLLAAWLFPLDRGLISRVVISSVLVWTRDERKRTSPEACIPTATCHFSHGGHRSGPEARTQLNHSSTTQLVNYSLVFLTSWPIEPWLNKRGRFKEIQVAFANVLSYLHLSETNCVGCVSNSFWGSLPQDVISPLFFISSLKEGRLIGQIIRSMIYFLYREFHKSRYDNEGSDIAVLCIDKWGETVDGRGKQ